MRARGRAYVEHVRGPPSCVRWLDFSRCSVRNKFVSQCDVFVGGYVAFATLNSVSFLVHNAGFCVFFGVCHIVVTV